MTNNIGYLGKSNEHLKSLTIALSEFDVRVVPIELSRNLQSGGCLKHKLNRVLGKIYGTNLRESHDAASLSIANNGLSIIVAYWGTNIVPDIIAIKKCYPNVKIVLNVMCYPMGLTPFSVACQNIYMKYAGKFIDGYIFSNSIMSDYFKNRIFAKKNLSSIVVPTLLSRKELQNQVLEPCSNQPNLLFLGRPDWWKGQPTDNLNDQLKNAIQAGIHVYHAGDTAICNVEERRHVFEYMGFSKLKTFASQFDASLIMYNLGAATNLDRFRNTIPDRLIASVAIGIPIAVPRVGYDAIKLFLKDYEAVIEFDDFDELYSILKNRIIVDKLRNTALSNSIEYSQEIYVPQLLSFFKNL